MTFRREGNSLKNMPNMPALMCKFRNMKRTIPVLFLFMLTPCFSYGQKPLSLPGVAEIKWELDFDIYLRMANDSAYTFDIRGLFHVKDESLQKAEEFVLYPVNLGEDYVNGIAAINAAEPSQSGPYKTLWGALHTALGGGWVHFNNCLLYAFETNYLSLTAPLMQRPSTSWKPDPVTETYLRTKNWNYYTPTDQHGAHKEFRIRKRNNQLGDIKSIPPSIIDLFHSTGSQKYQKLVKNGETKKTAQIDLVKLMLGVNYLGEPQISYVRSAVLNAIKNYSANKLPTVVIFDRLHAAVVMNLGQDGYNIDAIAFRNAESLTAREAAIRQQEIQAIIDDINEYNRNQFMKRLDSYYNP
jgi:hypothetical protein